MNNEGYSRNLRVPIDFGRDGSWKLDLMVAADLIGTWWNSTNSAPTFVDFQQLVLRAFEMSTWLSIFGTAFITRALHLQA
jgi:hypothetical protein